MTPLQKAGRLWWNGLLDFVYPPHCLVCDAFGHPAICPACYAGFLCLPEPVCEICGRPLSTQENIGEDDERAAPIAVMACRYCEAAAQAGGVGI